MNKFSFCKITSGRLPTAMIKVFLKGDSGHAILTFSYVASGNYHPERPVADKAFIIPGQYPYDKIALKDKTDSAFEWVSWTVEKNKHDK